MAPRANWKGYLRLSLVSCPIALGRSFSCEPSDRVAPRPLNRDSPYEPPNQCEFLRFCGVLARQAVARTAAATWTVGNGG